ncbi:MAG TPA: hypothetical protein VFV17_00205, partial [Usitatibacteraceae bacterium]|nr:hypothetical protein [Usitatibacteraceae bacterium]
MDPGARRAAVAGHSGLVGRALLERLRDCPQYNQIHCVGRRPPDRQEARIVFHPHDLKTVPALPPLDDAYCCLGTTIAKAGSQDAFREVDDAMVRRFAQAA